MPWSLFSQGDPHADPVDSAGPTRPGYGRCGDCLHCPRYWRIVCTLTPGEGVPDAYGGETILERRRPSTPELAAKCVWLSPPSDALVEAGFGAELAGASLWRLSFDAEPDPLIGTGPAATWLAGAWSLCAGAFYWPQEVQTAPLFLLPGAPLTSGSAVGFAGYRQAPTPQRPWLCLSPNPLTLHDDSTGQFPATITPAPWWP